jgi:lipoprotein-anchoring transpeptidase ErfK/SrfK
MTPVRIAIGLTTAVVLFVVVVLVIDATRKDVIADGVRIGTVDVGGLERDEARALVQRKLARNVTKRLAVIYRGQHFVLRPEVPQARLDADASVDAALRRSGDNPFSRVLGGSDAAGTVTPRVEFSRAAVEDFAARIAKRVNRDARDADIDWHDGKLDRTRARNGVEVLRSELVASLVSVMTKPGRRKVDVPVKVTERPDRNLDDLAKRYPTVVAVDRDAKQLRLYKNLQLEHRYEIAVGKAGTETTAGRYKIVEKIVNPPWHAPNKAWAGDLAGKTIPSGDPQNPLEARWLGFHDGQGIHGTKDVASLGTAASHGCIRMSVPDVKQLYALVPKGTPLFLQ